MTRRSWPSEDLGLVGEAEGRAHAKALRRDHVWHAQELESYPAESTTILASGSPRKLLENFKNMDSLALPTKIWIQ